MLLLVNCLSPPTVPTPYYLELELGTHGAPWHHHIPQVQARSGSAILAINQCCARLGDKRIPLCGYYIGFESWDSYIHTLSFLYCDAHRAPSAQVDLT